MGPNNDRPRQSHLLVRIDDHQQTLCPNQCGHQKQHDRSDVDERTVHGYFSW
jgi:hypothetical protein